MKVNKFIVFFAFAILTFSISISPAGAAGCCFYSSTGLCSNYADQSACESSGGTYSSSSSCSTGECVKGCCILGGNVEHVTSRTCELLSDTYGFSSANFQTGASSYCSTLAETLDETEGACLGGDYPPYDCRFVADSACSTGNFFPGMTCTNPNLNTSCNATSTKICYDDDVYTRDSCGNPDALSSNCDYESGTICDDTTGTAYCKSLDCEGGKKNDESWCIGTNYEGAVNITYPDVGTSFGWRGFGNERDDPPVGSRFYTQYCIEGTVYTEPCADFRAESCSDGECKINRWLQCIAAGNDSESCDSEYCQMFDGFRSHCVWDSAGAGYCTKGDDTSAWYPATVTGDEYEYTGSANSEPIGKGELPEGTTYGGKSDAFINNLLLDMCIPKIQGGIQFYPSESLSGANTGGTTFGMDGESSGEDVCAAGNYATDITFKYDGRCIYLDTSILGTEYGSAALLASTPDMWRVADGKVYGTKLNPYVYCGKAKDLEGWTTVMVDFVSGNFIFEIFGVDWFSDALHDVVTDVLDWLPDWLADIFLKDRYRNVGLVPYMASGEIDIEKLPLNGNAVKAMISRCKAISDCTVQWSWLGQDVGSASSWGDGFETIAAETGIFNVYCETSGNTVTCPFSFECVPWSAPGGSNNCHYCGEDGLPCSEYRCKAAGSGCSYKQPDGADKGYCVASGDNTAPAISLDSMNPASPIPPYTPVEINISTSETARCRFNINEAASTFDEMNYEFGDLGYSTSHSVVLTLPGQTHGLNRSDYPLLTTDGNYTLYVKCLDVSGNGEYSAPYPINFEVMQYPDGIPPILSNFAPVSGSSIKFNTTSKLIRFKLDAPAECRWSLEDKGFNESENNFSCDTMINADPTDTYECSGTLTNVTTNMGEQTRFYIKCKDQPWLEGIEDDLYKRNEQDSRNDYEYILRPSEELLLTEVSPTGDIRKPGSNLSVELDAITYGGSHNGLATCYWRQSNESWPEGKFYTIFNRTNSNINRQILNGIGVGTNYIQVKCNDSAENEVSGNTSFNLAIDASSPFINRIFEFSGALRLKTDEESLCYVSFNRTLGCLFNLANATLMTGAEKDHTTGYNEGAGYYIRCKDYYGNEDPGCGKIIKTW